MYRVVQGELSVGTTGDARRTVGSLAGHALAGGRGFFSVEGLTQAEQWDDSKEGRSAQPCLPHL